MRPPDIKKTLGPSISNLPRVHKWLRPFFYLFHLVLQGCLKSVSNVTALDETYFNLCHLELHQKSHWRDRSEGNWHQTRTWKNSFYSFRNIAQGVFCGFLGLNSWESPSFQFLNFVEQVWNHTFHRVTPEVSRAVELKISSVWQFHLQSNGAQYFCSQALIVLPMLLYQEMTKMFSWCESVPAGPTGGNSDQICCLRTSGWA